MLKACWLLAMLVGAHVAAAQEASIGRPERLFTDQVLAPRADWYRPDLAAHRVRQVGRTYAAGLAGQVLGLPHPVLEVSTGQQPVRETLRYDEQGYLRRYEFALAAGHNAWHTLVNEFDYDASHRLRRIAVSGSPVLTEIDDPIARSLYAFRRRHSPLLKARHGLTTTGRWMAPDCWQLNAVLCGYDAVGRALPPQAVVTIGSSATQNRPAFAEAWIDTLLLDPQRGWQLSLPAALVGQADSTWLTDPDRWWQPQVAEAAGGSLRVQHLPLWYRYSDYAGAVENTEPLFLATSFFGPDGHLLLHRTPNYGGVWRYRYDAQGQPWQTEAYFLHLPNGHYRDTLCFGNISDVSSILDCAQRLRQPWPLPDGSQAVREFCWRQEVRYALNRRGLPRRATLCTTLPRYAADASFSWTLSPFWKRHDNYGPPRKKKNWRCIQAMVKQAEQFRQQGCVPILLSTHDTPAIRFRYEFFP